MDVIFHYISFYTHLKILLLYPQFLITSLINVIALASVYLLSLFSVQEEKNLLNNDVYLIRKLSTVLDCFSWICIWTAILLTDGQVTLFIGGQVFAEAWQPSDGRTSVQSF